ncbi:transcriptional regulatory protein [Sinomonas cellulolyticus]|jgi:two-component system CitB family response regulator|uniref:Transcriptional regulatory protein n=1 Tax=Sinomonas cellulolyticus TaxID=2801916 RepID=A0ABS1JX51_9MICC|nr:MULTISPECIES: response regulator [Sinomonas]MBL0703909.1 response regulator [Sinomonas cellulolyticus]GHG57565.1 transcriptional regulatory protein [Sinomonas sp. KCTC 49339]
MSESLRVLIVDDDFRVARLHAEYVGGAPGFVALDPVGSAAAALDAARAFRPDLVLIDVYLPDGNGLDVLPDLEADSMVLSAASDAATVSRAYRRGAIGYLIKPFAERLLQERLRGYSRYRRVLESTPDLTQDTVDRARRHLLPASVQPTASRSLTEGAVVDALVAAGAPLTALDIATAVGISRATAQRHLSALVEEGAVEMGLRYGTTGRPEHRYSVRG